MPRPMVFFKGLLAEMPPNRMDGKNLFGGLVLAVIVGAIFVVANLPYLYVESHTGWFGNAELERSSGQDASQNPILAGWPLRYQIQATSKGEVVQNRFFSWTHLAINVLLGLTTSCLVFWISRARAKKIRLSANPRATKRLFDVGLAATMILIPGTIATIWYWETTQQQKLAFRIAEHGNCFLSSWLPKPFADHIPSGLVDQLRRIRHVQCVEADDDLMKSICSIPSLVQLDSYQGKFKGAILTKLLDLPFLKELSLYRHSLSEEEVDTIAKLPWLSKLRLSRTNLDQKLFKRLDSMPKIRSLNLTFCEFRLDEIGSPAWSSTLEELVLTRPISGDSDSLMIEGWPSLRVLSVTRPTTRLNDSVLTLRLTDLPLLETLRTDRLQKHNFYARNLPRLQQIDDGLSSALLMLDSNLKVPGLGWYTHLHLEDMPSLQKVECFARDLETFRLKNLGGLRSFEIGSYFSCYFGNISMRLANPSRCQAWVDELGRCDGPAKITFAGLPLDQVDMAPLTANNKIRNLDLQETGLAFEQVKSLAKLRDLSVLKLGDCRIESDELAWFVEQFPQLEELKIYGENVSTYILDGFPKLRQVETSTLRRVERIRIVDQPGLLVSLRVEAAPDEIEIRNAPALQGLAVAQPWPRQAAISGLRDIRTFSAGGANVDDSLLEELLSCPNLDQLTLAYPTLSESSVRRIGELNKLTALVVPGAGINDEITSDWKRIQSLWEINLDDNRVGVETIAWLSGIESLRSLSLNRVPLDYAALDSLSELRHPSAIYLSGVKLRRKDILTLLNSESLEILDISGNPIDDKILSRVASSTTLKFLIARDCGLTDRKINQLLESNPTIVVDNGLLDSDSTFESARDSIFDAKLRSEITQRSLLFRTQFPSYLPTSQSQRLSAAKKRNDSDLFGTAERTRLEPINPVFKDLQSEFNIYNGRNLTMEAEDIIAYQSKMDLSRADLELLRQNSPHASTPVKNNQHRIAGATGGEQATASPAPELSKTD